MDRREIMHLFQELREASSNAARKRKRGTLLLEVKNTELSLALETRNREEIEKRRQECIDVFTSIIDTTIADYAKCNELEDRLNALKPKV